MDVESAERSIGELINKRSRERSEANAISEVWASSEKRHRERRREENREAWVAFYRGLARAHHDLAARNSARADAVEEEC